MCGTSKQPTSTIHGGGAEIVILVTGASGLLGANFVLAARRADVEVVATYREFPVHFAGAEAVRADLLDHASIQALVEDVRPGWVVHCAAATDVDWCEAHPEEAQRINAEASGALAFAAAAVGSRFLYISTDAVFDGHRGDYGESDPPSPANAYGHSKLKGEHMVLGALPSSLVVRTNLYGWNVQPKQSLAEWILARLEAGQEVPGFEDVIFTPILADHLAAALLKLIQRSAEGLYHVAGSEALSKYEFARRVAKVFGHDPGLVRPVPMATSRLQAPRPKNSALESRKAASALGGELPGTDEGIQQFKHDRDSGYVRTLHACRGA